MAGRRRAAVLGVGATPFDAHEAVPIEVLGRRAVVAAMRDAGVARERIGAAFVAHLYQGEVLGQRILRGLDFPRNLPVTNIENACAGGSTAVRAAFEAVVEGRCDLALAVGAEKMGRGQVSFVTRSLGQALGANAPAGYALAGRRHMHEFGTSAEAFAGIAVKNRFHGSLNPHARFHDPVTLEEVLASRTIADPLTLLQCCRNGSGAAAVVVGSEREAAAQGGVRVWIEAAALASAMSDGELGDITDFGATRVAAAEAYEGAAVDPADLDAVELHDAFTIGELLHYEGLGLCAKGDGARLVADGDTRLGGRVPVNASGGMLAKSHPLGATGVVQICELAWQLRGEAGKRQVEGARLALAHSQGGAGEGSLATCVTVLSRG